MDATTALLLIDIQNDYFPGGAMPLQGSERAAENAAALLRCARRHKRSVFHIAHESVRPGASFFLPATPGQAIHQLVEPEGEETVIVKHYPNSFLKTGLEDSLRQQGITHLLIAGMMTHMCVDATVRAAKDLGFDCTLAHDATATRALAFGNATAMAEQVQTAFIAALSGICDRIISTEAIIEAMDAAPAAP